MSCLPTTNVFPAPSNSLAAQISTALESSVPPLITGGALAGVATQVTAQITNAIIAQVATQVANLVGAKIAGQIAGQIANSLCGAPVSLIASTASTAAAPEIATQIISQLATLIGAQIASEVGSQAASSIANSIAASIGAQLGSTLAGDITALASIPAAPTVLTTALVNGQTLGTLRNDWTGPIGFTFTAANNATCIALGRWIVGGNNQPHTIALCSSTGSVLAYGTLTTAGKLPWTYAYVTLATPYALASGTTYAIVSQEQLNGDQWCDLNSEITPTSESSTAVHPVFAAGSLVAGIEDWTIDASLSGVGFGPVNMLYTIP